MNAVRGFDQVVRRGRPSGLGEVVAAGAGAVIWLHLLDAALVHRQVHASLLEHVVLAVLAVVLPPLAYVAYLGLPRAWRGAGVAVLGAAALGTGGAIHVGGWIRTGTLVRSDFTGVAMAVAGAVLLVLGLALLTAAIPRVRYRLLMVPAVLLGVQFVAVPVGAVLFICHAPRQHVEARDLGAAYEEVEFETEDGLTLRGWYVPSKNGAAVALLHGSGGTRGGPSEHARMLVGHGYGVLTFDASGHGESDGSTNMVGWGAHGDLAAAAAYLAARPDVEAGRVGALGLSMGAEIAIEAAAYDDGFAAIVADGPSGRAFSDTRDMSLSLLDRVMAYPSSVAIDLGIAALSGHRPPPALSSLSPRIDEPVLYIASGDVTTERTVVTKIAERSGGAPELWVIDGAGHTQGLSTFPEEYERRVVGFFDRLLLAPEGTGTTGATGSE